MSESGLAAVHAAGMNSTALAALSESTAAAALAVATKPATAAELSAAFPDLCAQLCTEAATAERTRILGIESNALQGHEALIASMKADPTISPDMAAGRLLAAEKQLRAGHLQGLKDVETLTGKVAAAASAAPAASAEAAASPEGWDAEWKGSKDLQKEFSSSAVYVAFKTAEEAGTARIKRS